jgi:hypothetical protein
VPCANDIGLKRRIHERYPRRRPTQAARAAFEVTLRADQVLRNHNGTNPHARIGRALALSDDAPVSWCCLGRVSRRVSQAGLDWITSLGTCTCIAKAFTSTRSSDAAKTLKSSGVADSLITSVKEPFLHARAGHLIRSEQFTYGAAARAIRYQCIGRFLHLLLIRSKPRLPRQIDARIQERRLSRARVFAI